jgi:uncharacterized protein YkwD
MFKYKNKKIIALTVVILLIVVSLFSISFSTKVPKTKSSFACTTSEAIKSSKTQVMETAAGEEEAQSKATVAAGIDLGDLETEILNLINKARADHGLRQLIAVQSLNDIAIARSADMVSRDYFSHYTPEGNTFFNIMRKSGINWTNAGENLGNSTPVTLGTSDAFISAWLKSPSHRDNILRSNYRLFGIGIIDDEGRRVVTTIFLN